MDDGTILIKFHRAIADGFDAVVQNTDVSGGGVKDRDVACRHLFSSRAVNLGFAGTGTSIEICFWVVGPVSVALQ